MMLPNDHIETVCGSPLYMAPEVLQFQEYDDKVEVFNSVDLLECMKLKSALF